MDSTRDGVVVRARLYHGTNVALVPGDVLVPGRANHWGVPESRAGFVYASTDPDAAAGYARHAAAKAGGEPVVYEVTAHDPVLDFTDGEYVWDYRMPAATVVARL